jgi:hypothetical protein
MDGALHVFPSSMSESIAMISHKCFLASGDVLCDVLCRRNCTAVLRLVLGCMLGLILEFVSW